MEIAPTTHSTAAKDHLVRCISCGEANGTLAADFRCLHCGDLLAVDFPKWSEGLVPDPARVKALWRERRTSNQPLDSSGDRKSTRLNSSHSGESRMPSSA